MGEQLPLCEALDRILKFWIRISPVYLNYISFWPWNLLIYLDFRIIPQRRFRVLGNNSFINYDPKGLCLPEPCLSRLSLGDAHLAD